MDGVSETAKNSEPLRFDADGNVVGDRLDPAEAAPLVVEEAFFDGKSPTLDLYNNPPPPLFVTAPGDYAGVGQSTSPPPVGGIVATSDADPIEKYIDRVPTNDPPQSLGGEIQRLAPDNAPVSLDIDRPPENKRLLPEAFYAKRARPVRITEITADQVILFLDNLAELGLWEMAAARAGMNKRIVDKIRKFDADFKEACDRAMAQYVDRTEKKITDRAVDGWDEPQFNHKTGMQLGTIRKFDSRLAELVLKRLNPAYRDRFEGEVKVTGGVMVVPGRASVDDFMKMQNMDIVEGEIVGTPTISPSAPGEKNAEAKN